MRDVDRIIETIKRINPEVVVRQLKVVHPGMDDDGIWYFDDPDSGFGAQIESSYGMCPFIIETEQTDERFTGTSITQTVEIVVRLLHLDKSTTGPGAPSGI